MDGNDYQCIRCGPRCNGDYSRECALLEVFAEQPAVPGLDLPEIDSRERLRR
jgi:hypothetical protein